MKKQYKTPHDWYNSNKSKLRKYKSEWIAFTNDGVIVHDKNLFKVAKATDNLPVSQYTIDYIFDSDFVEPVRLLPIRFKNVKRHEWQPKYQVVLKAQTSKSIEMLVDSGADFSLIPKDLGVILSFCVRHGTNLIIINGEELSPEQELVQDILSIIPVFSARLNCLTLRCCMLSRLKCFVKLLKK